VLNGIFSFFDMMMCR